MHGTIRRISKIISRSLRYQFRLEMRLIAFVVIITYYVKQIHGTLYGAYIGSYQNYPTGLTFIEVLGLDSGSRAPNTKWGVECGDHQALVGIRDTGYRFTQIQTVECKVEFPHKPATNGFYPYYERCQVRNISLTVNEFFCFDPKIDENSVDTFVVALWDDDLEFHYNDIIDTKPYIGTAMKCCGTPPGYSLAYGSCIMLYTHDETWEYFDSLYFVVECPDGHVIAGIGVVQNPISMDHHYDWIQCCPVLFNGLPIVGRINYPPPADTPLLSADQYNDLLSYKRVTRRPSSTTTSTIKPDEVKIAAAAEANNSMMRSSSSGMRAMQALGPGGARG